MNTTLQAKRINLKNVKYLDKDTILLLARMTLNTVSSALSKRLRIVLGLRIEENVCRRSMYIYYCPGALSNASPGASFIFAASGLIPSRAVRTGKGQCQADESLKDGLSERTLKWRSIPPPADRGGDRVAHR